MEFGGVGVRARSEWNLEWVGVRARSEWTSVSTASTDTPSSVSTG